MFTKKMGEKKDAMADKKMINKMAKTKKPSKFKKALKNAAKKAKTY